MQHIDMNVTFNPAGEMKPIVYRVVDEMGQRRTIKVREVVQVKEGFRGALIFVCACEINGLIQQVEIQYNIKRHYWSVTENQVSAHS